MEEVTQLEKFLAIQAETGQHQEQGEFTIDQQSAIEKLAAFQLPFSGAWLLKVVQAAVAANCEDGIAISVRTKETQIKFRAQIGTVSDIRSAILNPQLPVAREVEYLATALRVVSMRDRRPYILTVPYSGTLVWDGREFHQNESDDYETYVSLAVSHLGIDDGGVLGGLFSRKRKDEIASQTRRIHTRCFFCPVPLEFDGKRLDHPYGNPMHGLNNHSFPFAASWHQLEGIPPLRLPNAELSLANQEAKKYYPRFQEIARRELDHKRLPPRASTFHLLCAHFQRIQEGDRVRWDTLRLEPQCYWIQDGVLIDQESLVNWQFSVSNCVYLSAEGLDKDLTGFQLKYNDERRRRVQQACRAVCEVVGRADLDDFVLNTEEAFVRPFHGMLGGAGISVLLVGLKTVALPLGLAVGGVAAGVTAYMNRCQRSQVVSVRDGLVELQERFREIAPSAATR